MQLRKNILTILFLIFICISAYSQSNSSSHKVDIKIPEVALLNLVSNNTANINLNSISPVEAGNPIKFSDVDQNKDIWINYSSIIQDQNHLRKIVAILQGDVPQGFHLLVEASEALGAGKGKTGASAGTIVLSNQPTEIITDIGSCYTGVGTNNGHLLKYKLEFDESANSFAQLTESEISFNVVYTLTDTN